MSDIDQLQHQVRQALAAVALPYGAPLTAADALVVVEPGSPMLVHLTLGYPCEPLREQLITQVRQQLSAVLPGAFDVKLDWQVAQVPNSKQVAGVRNIVAVASGKGGVGKSTTSANLALALAALGARVGVLDADIYGPSQAQMLGVADRRPEMHSPTQMKPIAAAGGLQMMSMGNLVTENTPMIWRGPMVSGALQQLLNQTHWQDVDYLIVDMPPGTGDIQLTLAQSVPVAGSVIVTTPQDIALLDAKKAIEMFRKVNIPVLGVVENMAWHECTACGHQDAIFGRDGGERLAQQYQVEVLGQLPLQTRIREQTDSGIPPVLADPEGEVAQIYRQIALGLAAGLWQLSRTTPAAPTISVSDD